LGQVGITLFEALESVGDQLARPLVEPPIEGVDVGAREADPLADHAHELLCPTIDIGLLIARILDREHQVLAVNSPARWIERK